MKDSRICIWLIFPVAVISVLGGLSCSAPGPSPIHYGEDICAYCRMTIIDRQFGTELVTRNGKVYNFDSIECLAAYGIEQMIAREDIHSRWVTDFSSPPDLIPVSDAVYVHAENVRSPMGIGLLAFSSLPSARKSAGDYDGETIEWNDLESIVADAWSLETRSEAEGN